MPLKTKQILPTSPAGRGVSLAAMLLGAALSLATAVPAHADNHEPMPEVTSTPLTGTLHLLQGRGGNVVASVGEDGLLIIDDDYANMVPAYEAALIDLAGADANPRFVLNTHWHSGPHGWQPVLGRSRRRCGRSHPGA